MAKTTAPLFGFGASGKLGGALVFGTWKGLDVARRYVIPANPNTAPQSTQRGYLTAAVDAWHTTGANALEAADKAAWNRLAGVIGRMSGFNAFCQAWMRESADGGTVPGHFFNMDVTAPAHAAFACDIDSDIAGTPTATLYLGTSKTFFPYTDSAALSSGNAAFTAGNTGFAAGETVYFYVEVGTPGTDYARTGLYTVVLT
jgi:hypothetical protein